MSLVSALTALRLLACLGLADASVRHEMPRVEASSDASVASTNEEVTLTASGAVHRPSSIIRRHADHEEEIFRAFDLNGDGLASPAEVEMRLKQDKQLVPKESALFEVKELGRDVLRSAAQADLPGDDDSWVTCGGHKAPTCAACPMTDSDGRTVFDHGEEWCHGACVHHQGKCHKSGTVIVNGTSKGEYRGYNSTPVPDILKPEITKQDERTIDNSAEAAIREENLEAAQKAREEEEAIQAQKFSWSKFWLVTCITVSVILGICACVSVCVLVVYVFMPTPGNKLGEDGEEEEEAKDGEEQGGEEATADAGGDEATAEAEAEGPPQF